MILMMASCQSTAYSILYFTYPPDTKPHEGDYEYLGMIYYETQQGENSTDRKQKNVRIEIKDKEKNIKLKREYQLTSATIDHKTTWDDLNTLRIELYERGNKYNDTDDYNRFLLEEGPRKLLVLEFTYDKTKDQFIEPIIEIKSE